MRSRYDFMENGMVQDKDGEFFPDPLLDWEVEVKSIPTLYTITEVDLSKFWLVMWKEYGVNHSDDLWLNANGIPYVMDLKPGDQIYKIRLEELIPKTTL